MRSLILLALLWAAPIGAVPVAELRASLGALRVQDARVAAIGDRLAIANAGLCRDRIARAGLMLHHLGQYEPPFRAAAMAEFGLGDGPSILTVVPGGTADRAGIRPDDRLIAIDGGTIAPVPMTSEADRGPEAANAVLMRSLDDGTVTLTIERSGQRRDVTITPPEGCVSTFQVRPAAAYAAQAAGGIVEVTTALVDYAADDAELAAVLSHELAHNILDHRARLKAEGVPGGFFRRFGANAKRVRETEIEADRLCVTLLAAAGYDPAAAPRFWRRFGRDHGHGIFADATHPGWRERARRLEELIAALPAGR